MNYLKRILCLGLICISTNASARESAGSAWSFFNGLDYRLKAGYNIGASSPLPLPAEIRELRSFNPGLNLSIEGNAIKWFDPNWGASLSVRFEGKGMATDARVKNYFLVMDSPEQGHIEGVWTGNVTTRVKNTFVTIPLLAMYKATPRLEVKAGPYISFLTEKSFTGAAYDGYIREGDPTGDKIVIEGSNANYDFSDDLRNIQWGVDLGAEWQAYKLLLLFADLSWGLNSLFPKDFECVSFELYNIYLNIGLGYRF